MTHSCNREMIIEKIKELKIQRRKIAHKEVKKEDLLDESKQNKNCSSEEDMQDIIKLFTEIQKEI